MRANHILPVVPHSKFLLFSLPSAAGLSERGLADLPMIEQNIHVPALSQGITQNGKYIRDSVGCYRPDRHPGGSIENRPCHLRAVLGMRSQNTEVVDPRTQVRLESARNPGVKRPFGLDW